MAQHSNEPQPSFVLPIVFAVVGFFAGPLLYFNDVIFTGGSLSDLGSNLLASVVTCTFGGFAIGGILQFFLGLTRQRPPDEED